MITAYVIFAVCMFGCAAHAYFLGRRVGIEATVTFLIDQGVLEVDSEGDV
tara:strand:+ start:2189 stop:2338 length:150 start_codon:yes stop_codon:yes gene_type:complete